MAGDRGSRPSLREQTQFDIVVSVDDDEARGLASALDYRPVTALTSLHAVVPALVVAAHLALLLGSYYFISSDRTIGSGAGSVASSLSVDHASVFVTTIAIGFAVGLGVLVHELSHALLHAVSGVRVRGIGVRVLLVVPVGVFLRYDASDWQTLSSDTKAAILSAGVIGNVVIALGAYLTQVYSGSASPVLFWLWVVNGLLALWNCLPVPLTDGDRLLLYALTGSTDADDVTNTTRLRVGAAVSGGVLVGSALAIGIGHATAVA